jgi:hypothetical protein
MLLNLLWIKSLTYASRGRTRRTTTTESHMQKSDANWLRDHMRNHITNSSAIDSAQNILSFSRPPNSATKPGDAALELVYQAAERIREADKCASERQARAETLAKQTLENLKIAEARVQSAETERLAAETKIKEFSDRLEKELSEVGKVMEQTASRIRAAEAKLSAAEQRAGKAEIRANEAENALKRIEDAIRTRILENSSKAATAA